MSLSRRELLKPVPLQWPEALSALWLFSCREQANALIEPRNNTDYFRYAGDHDGRSQSAPRRYTCRVPLVRRAFGSYPADSITPQDISRWLERCRASENWSSGTANRYKAFLSLSFRLGIENRKCSQNPARFVRRQLENDGRIRCLSEGEEETTRRYPRNRRGQDR